MRLSSILLIASLAAAPASAATIYSSEAAWEAAMVSTTPVALPPTAATTSFSTGGVTFSIDGSATNLIVGGAFDWSTVIPGDDLAVSAPEDVRIDFATAVTGFAFLLHEPTASGGQVPDSCNATCFDSTFNFKLYSGATLLGSFDLDPLDDVANFVGFSSATAFDRLVIDDVTNQIDNEFFGQFRTGEFAAVPLPAGLGLLLGGLGMMALIRRRKV